CHAGEVLKPIDDYVRSTFRLGGPLAIQAADKKALVKLRKTYLADLQKWLKRDVGDYREAFALATITPDYPKGLPAKRASTAYASAFHSYADRPLSLADAARELGVPAWRWRAALQASAKATGQLDLLFATWLDDPPGKLSRVSWEDSYALAQTILHGKGPVNGKGVK